MFPLGEILAGCVVGGWCRDGDSISVCVLWHGMALWD